MVQLILWQLRVFFLEHFDIISLLLNEFAWSSRYEIIPLETGSITLFKYDVKEMDPVFRLVSWQIETNRIEHARFMFISWVDFFRSFVFGQVALVVYTTSFASIRNRISTLRRPITSEVISPWSIRSRLLDVWRRILLTFQSSLQGHPC